MEGQSIVGRKPLFEAQFWVLFPWTNGENLVAGIAAIGPRFRALVLRASPQQLLEALLDFERIMNEPPMPTAHEAFLVRNCVQGFAERAPFKVSSSKPPARLNNRDSVSAHQVACSPSSKEKDRQLKNHSSRDELRVQL